MDGAVALAIVLKKIKEGGGEGAKADWVSNVAVGGINSGVDLTGMSTLEILKKMTRKYTNATCTVNFSEGNSLQEVGSNLNINISVSNFKKGDYNCSKVALYKGSTLLEEKTATGTVTFSTVNNITTDTTFTVKLTDENNVVTSYSKSYKFVRPTYVGVVDNGNVNETSITTLCTKLIRENQPLTQKMTAAFQTIVFATTGTLTSIINQNNYEVIGSFTKSTVNIGGVNYNVYALVDVNVSNFGYTFKF